MRKLALLFLLVFAVTAQARMKLQGYAAASTSVTVKLTGTSTNATIYSDAAGTSKSNPFTAAADGFYSFYVDNGSYDIVTTATTWTDIRVSEVGVTSSVTGFGAKCDGSTDDTAAIQRAINVASPNHVRLPTATCVITDTILIGNHRTTLEGNGPDASQLAFVPAADNKAAIKVKLSTAAVISLVRLRGFSLHSNDTTHVKIGIDIVDGSETVLENIVVGNQDTWYGGTSVSPFTGTGSIGIRLQGRDLGTFRNVRSCGAIPLYIGNNPNISWIDLDHHQFDGFIFIARCDNPAIYVEDGAVLTNVIFENGSWDLGGYGFYWPDTTSTVNSMDLTFRNIRAEQFTGGYAIYITKASPLRGLRIQDFWTGNNADNKGVYLRGIAQVVFDVYNYHGTLECLNTDSHFDWRNSFCLAYSTVNLNSLVEVWAESFAVSGGPMPMFGRWENAHAMHAAGVVYRYMGVFQLAKTGSLTNTSTVQIPSAGGSITLGRISIAFKGATKSGSFTVAVNSAGAAQESTTDATITGVGNVANKITVHWSSASNIVIRNNLGETVTYSYSYFWD